MNRVGRSWLGFAALGIGLVHLALVVSSPVPLAVALVALGVAELAWAVATLRAERLPTPRAAIAGLGVGLLGWLAALAAFALLPSTEALPRMLPLSLAAVLQFGALIALLTVQRRQARGRTSTPREPTPARQLIGLTAGALLVGFIVTPALSATTAGDHARPHGELHGGGELPPDDPHH